jgi:hypothetical protein
VVALPKDVPPSDVAVPLVFALALPFVVVLVVAAVSNVVFEDVESSTRPNFQSRFT